MHDVSRSVHLPTRCPLCKGGVIERTASGAHSGYMWFHCLFCNHWWKFRIDYAEPNPEGELIGEISIVIKNGVTYNLDAVAVIVIPEDLARKHLDDKMQQREVESQRLRRECEALTAALEIARAEEDRLWKILQLDESNSEKAAVWRLAYNKGTKINEQLEELQKQQQHLSSAEYFFDGLPSGITTVKTDANGTFTLVIPRKGRYAVVARGPRDTFRDIEPDWFVWVSLEGEPSKRVALTNDNVLAASLETYAPENSTPENSTLQ